MPQDLFTIKKTVSELNSNLIGAKVNKILQPDNNEVNLVIFNGKSSRLIVSAHAKFSRVSISNVEKPNPETPFNFCMLLRKHLLGSVITQISVAGDDRIVKISFTNRNDFLEENFELYAEIMGKYSNVFLVKNGVILGAMKNLYGIENKRLILVGAKYSFPEKTGKISILCEDAKTVFENYNGGDFSKYLMANFFDFSPVTASEIASRVLSKNCDYNGENAYKIALDFINSSTLPTVIDDGVKKDFYVSDYHSIIGVRTNFSKITDAIEYVYEKQEAESFLSNKKSSLSTKIYSLEKKLTKRLVSLKEKIIEANDLEKLKLYGELITANLYKLKKGQTTICLTNYTEFGEEQVEISLDSTLSPQQNAQKFFKQYRKKKTAIELSKEQIVKVESELDYVLSIKFSLERAETVEDILEIKNELISSKIIIENAPSKKKQQVKPLGYKKYKINGFDIMLGKNNSQNDYILDKADKVDIWFHVKNYHSSHLIIKTLGNKVDENTLTICAEICAFYSQANGGGKTMVDYTFRRNVKKQGGNKLGSVYYQNQQTITVTPNPHNEYLIK